MEFLDKRPDDFELVLYEVRFVSDIAAKNPVIDAILERLKKKEYLTGGDDDLMNVRLVLEEAIVNAIRHGNEYDATKQVRVVLGEVGDEWGVVVEDEGEGFNPEDLPDPDDPASIFSEGGRGVFLMEYFMDRVVYYMNGAGVLFVKTKHTSTVAKEEGGQS